MNINWPEVIAGVVVGLLPLAIGRIYNYFHYVRSPGRRRFLGDWHGYWRSTTGRGLIGHERINIRYSLFRNRLIVRVRTPVVLADLAGHGAGRELEYEGTISERRGVVRYLHLRNRVNDFDEMWVLFDPFFDPIDVTEGVQVTVDLRGLPAATGQVLSREELPSDEVELRLQREIITTDPLQSFLRAHDYFMGGHS